MVFGLGQISLADESAQWRGLGGWALSSLAGRTLQLAGGSWARLSAVALPREAAGQLARAGAWREEELADVSRNAQEPGPAVLRRYQASLEQARQRLLAEEIFSEADLDVELIVTSGDFASAGVREARPGGKPQVFLDWRVFSNEDWLLVSLKRELAKLRLARLLPDATPARLEYFALQWINGRPWPFPIVPSERLPRWGRAWPSRLIGRR